MNASTNKMRTKLTNRLKQFFMNDIIKELTHYFSLQAGGGVRKRRAYHPTPQRDLMLVFDCNGGTKK